MWRPPLATEPGQRIVVLHFTIAVLRGRAGSRGVRLPVAVSATDRPWPGGPLALSGSGVVPGSCSHRLLVLEVGAETRSGVRIFRRYSSGILRRSGRRSPNDFFGEQVSHHPLRCFRLRRRRRRRHHRRRADLSRVVQTVDGRISGSVLRTPESSASATQLSVRIPGRLGFASRRAHFVVGDLDLVVHHLVLQLRCRRALVDRFGRKRKLRSLILDRSLRRPRTLLNPRLSR